MDDEKTFEQYRRRVTRPGEGKQYIGLRAEFPSLDWLGRPEALAF